MENEILYLEAIVKPLVSYPEEVRIEKTSDEMGILLSLNLHKDDMGKIIGKEGNTARAIRHIVRQYGMSRQARISIKINEPAGSVRSTSTFGGMEALR